MVKNKDVFGTVVKLNKAQTFEIISFISASLIKKITNDLMCVFRKLKRYYNLLSIVYFLNYFRDYILLLIQFHNLDQRSNGKLVDNYKVLYSLSCSSH